MKQKYWHELTEKEKESIFNSGIKVEDFLEQYKQPDWCTYPDALIPMLGCWSLTDTDKVIDMEFCGNCDLYVNKDCKPVYTCKRHSNIKSYDLRRPHP